MSGVKGKLIHSQHSPYARRVRIVLAELHLPYESDLRPSVYTMTELGDLNPNLMLPVWTDGAGTVFESNLIVEYLLTQYPAEDPDGALPMTPWLRRPDAAWQDGKLLATLDSMTDAGFLLRQLQQNGVDVNTVPYLRREQERIQRELDWLEAQVTPQGFAPGWFSIPDINLICALEWAEFRGQYAWRGRPKLEAVLRLHGDRPSVAGSRHR
jgi:glutathione S-transferase